MFRKLFHGMNGIAEAKEFTKRENNAREKLLIDNHAERLIEFYNEVIE